MSQRREQIIAAAGEIVATQGLAGLSVRNVAARAGIGASTLRHYFPTQRELYDAALGRTFDTHLDDKRLTDTTVAAADRLTECLAQFLPGGESERPTLEVWFAMHAQAIGTGRNDAGVLVLETLSKHGRARVSAWCATLEAEGALARDADRVTSTVMAVVDGLALDLVVPGTPLTVAEAHAVLRDVVEDVTRPAAGGSLTPPADPPHGSGGTAGAGSPPS
ncbi:TetR/AcrR family transcriptional regulator [Cellulomonas bogoriensis]|uniref:Transcriptional regulator n=1 Tax=Cellulomonas bogoriensis 69B4 = DSM 16987 TaxID=1386082 RepID=A0A0A0BQ45_9CELL|nr:TetR/AcrR family transcriptional regulator [Cellulomonas bogoriensis]KGM10091.1 transcriptional regulator [Cellulomonas bogoriensis 69B4 = DSM 16987]